MPPAIRSAIPIVPAVRRPMTIAISAMARRRTSHRMMRAGSRSGRTRMGKRARWWPAVRLPASHPPQQAPQPLRSLPILLALMGKAPCQLLPDHGLDALGAIHFDRDRYSRSGRPAIPLGEGCLVRLLGNGQRGQIGGPATGGAAHCAGPCLARGGVALLGILERCSAIGSAGSNADGRGVRAPEWGARRRVGRLLRLRGRHRASVRHRRSSRRAAATSVRNRRGRSMSNARPSASFRVTSSRSSTVAISLMSPNCTFTLTWPMCTSRRDVRYSVPPNPRARSPGVLRMADRRKPWTNSPGFRCALTTSSGSKVPSGSVRSRSRASSASRSSASTRAAVAVASRRAGPSSVGASTDTPSAAPWSRSTSNTAEP